MWCSIQLLAASPPPCPNTNSYDTQMQMSKTLATHVSHVLAGGAICNKSTKKWVPDPTWFRSGLPYRSIASRLPWNLTATDYLPHIIYTAPYDTASWFMARGGGASSPWHTPPSHSHFPAVAPLGPGSRPQGGPLFLAVRHEP